MAVCSSVYLSFPVVLLSQMSSRHYMVITGTDAHVEVETFGGVLGEWPEWKQRLSPFRTATKLNRAGNSSSLLSRPGAVEMGMVRTGECVSTVWGTSGQLRTDLCKIVLEEDA